MAIRGDFQTCLRTLIDVVETNEGISCVLVKETIGRSYTLYGLEDLELDWSKIAAGEQRVVLCVSQTELGILKTALRVEEVR